MATFRTEATEEVGIEFDTCFFAGSNISFLKMFILAFLLHVLQSKYTNKKEPKQKHGLTLHATDQVG